MEGKQPQHSEEIDLFYVFRPIYTRTSRHFAAIRANFLLFLAIVVVATALGYCARFFIPRKYETEGVFATRFLPANYCELMTHDLNHHSGEALIADRLHLSPEIAADISNIALDPLTAPLDRSDTLLQGFVLHLRLSRIESLDSIQQALIGFYENNDYAIRRKEEKRVALTALHQDIIRHINSLDSIAPLVNSSIVPRASGQGIILGQPIDPVNLYKVQDSFVRQRVKVETELGHLNNIEVVQSFLKFSEPNYPKLWMFVAWFAGAGLILAIFLTPALGKRR
jgi:hypothetical protein